MHKEPFKLEQTLFPFIIELVKVMLLWRAVAFSIGAPLCKAESEMIY